MRTMRMKTIAAAVTGAALMVALAGCGPAIIRERIPRQEISENVTATGGSSESTSSSTSSSTSTSTSTSNGSGSSTSNSTNTNADGTVHKRTTVAIQGATSAEVRLRMGVGTLEVSPGGAPLMEADFTVRPASWTPNVSYRLDNGRGALTVSQPSDSVDFGDRNARNEWDVRLGTETPLDLTVEKGVGKADLRLSGLDLRTLDVKGGAGETTIDLAGAPKHDVKATIVSGVGSVTLKVPRNVGVRLTGVHDGVGDWSAEGFTSEGDNAAVNAAWATAGVKMDITIQRGVGSVRVEQQ